MPLVEIIPAVQTDEQTLYAANDLIKIGENRSKV